MRSLANGAQRQFSTVTQAAFAPAGSRSDGKVGVGLVLKSSPETGYVEIVGFRQGSPAELSGLLPPTGDLLCEVDGRPVHKLEAKEVTKLILGPPNSQVTLTVKQNTPNSVHRRVTLTRAFEGRGVSGASPAAQNLASPPQQQQHSRSSMSSTSSDRQQNYAELRRCFPAAEQDVINHALDARNDVPAATRLLIDWGCQPLAVASAAAAPLAPRHVTSVQLPQQNQQHHPPPPHLTCPDSSATAVSALSPTSHWAAASRVPAASP